MSRLSFREDGANWGHSPDNASLGDRCEGYSGAGDMGGAYHNTGGDADRGSFRFGSQNQGSNFGSASNEGIQVNAFYHTYEIAVVREKSVLLRLMRSRNSLF